MTFAKRYAVVDNPTACSRRKIARSPIRARIVRAVPMKMAPTLSSTDWPRLVGASPPVSRTGTPKPTSPGTDSESTPMMNGRNARKDEVPAIGDDQPDLAPGRSWRTAVAHWFSSVSRGRRVSARVAAVASVRSRRCTAGMPRPGRARRREDVGPVRRAHRRADLVGAARRTRSCRRVPTAAPDRTRRGRTTSG